MIQIKTAQSADAHALAELARIIWKEHYTSILGEEQVHYMLETIQSEPAIQQDLEKGKIYWLVQKDGQDVGYVSYELEENTLFLSKFYLTEAARGKGLGRFLFENLKEVAADQSKQSIELTVNKHNAPTIKAYQKMGFEQIREQVADIGNGFVMDDYVFRYSL
ncbi:MAG: GNAT family N-acetyltransferase [Desemzia incerta]|uniref:GNAT family N-acetyltransferase n=1 Tax=Desemzia incerta TaxID=82801 RepID=UPI0033164540